MHKPTVSVNNRAYKTISQDEIVLGFSVKLFCPTTSLENIVSNPTSFPVPSFKDNVTELAAILYNYKQLFYIQLAQYTYFTRNVLIRYKKLDLMFPFQYFW